MVGQSLLERKIRWYFKNIEESIDLIGLEMILIAKFDDDGRLSFPERPQFHDIIALAKKVGILDK